eukprot:gene19698-biopygen16073
MPMERAHPGRDRCRSPSAGRRGWARQSCRRATSQSTARARRPPPAKQPHDREEAICGGYFGATWLQSSFRAHGHE